MVVLCDGADFAAVYFGNGQGKQAVVQQQYVAGFDVIRQLSVVEADAFASALSAPRGIQQQGFSRFDVDTAARNFTDADFRPLQIGHNGNFLMRLTCRLTHDFGIGAVEFGITVAEVEADDI